MEKTTDDFSAKITLIFRYQDNKKFAILKKGHKVES